MKARLLKKLYKSSLTRIANKIPAAFSDKADKKKWISQVTNAWVMDQKKKQNINRLN